eukprot:43223_1
MQTFVEQFIRAIDPSLEDYVIPTDVCRLCLIFYQDYHNDFILMQTKTNTIHISNFNGKSTLQFTNNEIFYDENICYVQNVKLPLSIAYQLNLSKSQHNILFKYGKSSQIEAYIIDRQSESFVRKWELPQSLPNQTGKLFFSNQLGLIHFTVNYTKDCRMFRHYYASQLLLDTLQSINTNPWSSNLWKHFELEAVAYSPVTDNMELDLESAGCCLIDDKILKIGGKVDGKVVKLYDIMNGFNNKTLKGLSINRYDFGCCYDQWKHNAYIAGGVIGDLLTDEINVTHLCQYYDFHKNQWYDLPYTRMQHYKPVNMWTDYYQNNLLYIASMSKYAQGIEYIDLRMKNRTWKVTHFEGSKHSLSSLFKLLNLPQHLG